ncbi:hypothetical protein CH341_07785 [Rhodoplanes roseus]|uniref:Uncharacterized protein n=1 Tax=Rhodoplanes roseus TaxID=29409 RepID=A0A327L3G3_9BRAD|nr:hypothetical protein CH341_07785 [Rhodoplanes roseus]
MSVAETLAAYRAALAEVGETITVRRLNPSPAAPTDVQALARITGYDPSEIVPGIQQGDRKVILLAEHVTLTPPLRAGDKLVVRGRVLNIETVDDSTRRLGGVLVAYELLVRG